MTMAPAEVEALVIYQIGALAAFAAAEGGRLTHVKPHGALNNQACEDAALADTVARAVRAVDRELILLAPALSELCTRGRARRFARGGGNLRRPRLHRRRHAGAAQPKSAP